MLVLTLLLPFTMPGKHFQYAFDISVAFKNVISEKHARQPVYVGMSV